MDDVIAHVRSAQAIWMKQEITPKRPDQIYVCFFEGPDDPAYYTRRLQDALHCPLTSLELVPCNGKDAVLGVREKYITQKNQDNLCRMYYIDHDYETIQNPSHCDTTFVTKGYSIENYYTTPAAFEGILQSLLHVSYRDPLFRKYVDIYTKVHSNFQSETRKIGAFILAMQHFNVEVQIKAFQYSKLFDVSSDQLSVKLQIDFNSIVSKYCKAGSPADLLLRSNRQRVQMEFQRILDDSSIPNSVLSHGKTEMKFFLNFVDSFVKMHKNEHPNMNSKDVTANFLRATSDCADTDPKLLSFLRAHVAS